MKRCFLFFFLVVLLGVCAFGQQGASVRLSGTGTAGNLPVFSSERVVEDSGVALGFGAQLIQTNTTLTLDYSTTHSFRCYMTNNLTLAFTNFPSSYDAQVKVELYQDSTGGHSVTWPAEVQWSFNISPTLSQGTDVYDIIYIGSADGGTTYYGIHSASEVE